MEQFSFQQPQGELMDGVSALQTPLFHRSELVFVGSLEVDPKENPYKVGTVHSPRDEDSRTMVWCALEEDL